MKNLAIFLCSTLLLTGCGSGTYKSKSPAGIAKPIGYPLPCYSEGTTVPRPVEVIGTVSVKNSGFTIIGGSVEAVMKNVMQRARQNGADAVQVTSIDKPDFENPNYRMTADLLRYSDEWETIGISENEFLAYLKRNRKSLDPIEGVWFADSQYGNRIAIMRNTSKPGRDFIGFILNTDQPAWRKGYKKIDIARGKQRVIYDFNFYLDDFNPVGTTVVLGNATEFTLLVQTADENKTVTY